MRLLSTCALVAVSLTAVPSLGTAQTVSWMIEGRVDSASTDAVDPGFFATFSAGSPVEVLLTYVTTAPETPWWAGNPNVGGYSLSTSALPPQLDMQAALGGHGYYQKPGSSVPLYVHRLIPQLHYDGTISERLGGDNVSTAFAWKPWALDFYLNWPGFPFATDALPTTVPHFTPTGGFDLYLRRCANTVVDPCPPGLPGPERVANVIGSWDTIKPVITRRLDFVPKDPRNVFDRRLALTQAAILGHRRFLPDVVVERSTIRLSGATAAGGCRAVDVNSDGFVDLVCAFRTGDIRPRPDERMVRLIARTIDGNYVQGFDTFTTR